MRTFPDYEAGRASVQNLSGPATTLKKRATWIPFVKVRRLQEPAPARGGSNAKTFHPTEQALWQYQVFLFPFVPSPLYPEQIVP